MDYISEGTAALEALKAAGAEDGALPDVNVDVDVADGELVYNVSFSRGGYDYHYEVSPNSGSIKNCVRQFANDMEALRELRRRLGELGRGSGRQLGRLGRSDR